MIIQKLSDGSYRVKDITHRQHLKKKGYSDKEIKEIEKRDIAYGKAKPGDMDKPMKQPWKDAKPLKPGQKYKRNYILPGGKMISKIEKSPKPELKHKLMKEFIVNEAGAIVDSSSLTDYDQAKYRKTKGGTPEAVEVQKEILSEFKQALKKLDQKVTTLSKGIQAKKLNTADVIYYLNQIKQML
jgi:hypothetical protein